MKVTKVLLVVLAIVALTMVACSPQDASNTDEIADTQNENSAEEEVTKTVEEDLLSDDDFVEIGEMI